MGEMVRTLKLLLETTPAEDRLFRELTNEYRDACNTVSRYVFDNGCILNYMEVQKAMYRTIRESTALKSQMAISVFRTVTAKYKTVREQLLQHPFRYRDGDGSWHSITRTLEWLQKPVFFSRPQADLVRGRDYSFAEDGTMLSVNTLERRTRVRFCRPGCFGKYFDGTWSFGTGKLVELNGSWYFHIPATKEVPDDATAGKAPVHVVGIDRGLRFLVTTYDEEGRTGFVSGREVLRKRQSFRDTRAELQARGTRSSKRALKRISGRENRWMSDVNHQISKALVDRYGADTLFVIEDLKDVSFEETNLRGRNSAQRNELRSWAFYQLETFLAYKAEDAGSAVLKVAADYTSQRCPRCGRIHKENRKHGLHEYVCDVCGYRSNDDRVGAMNIYNLGTLYVSGDVNPQYSRKA